MNEDTVSFKERLTREIEYKGFSKTEFAEKAGISLGTLNMYLYRDSIPSADIGVKLARLLNTTVEYLITGKTPSTFKASDWKRQEIITIMSNMNDKQISSFLEIARAYQNSYT